MKSVVICGSQRFKEEIGVFAKKLKELGVSVVFEPNFDRQKVGFIKLKESERLRSPSYKTRVPAMVHQHFDRIRKADVCYIYNKKGYLGVNTTLELGFAHGLNKIIYAREPEKSTDCGGEVCRDILFTEIIDSPEELVKRLV